MTGSGAAFITQVEARRGAVRSRTMEPTAGLILAAGLGTRFGGRKLLAPIYGKPMLQHVLDLAASAELSPVGVVLGTDANELLVTCTWRDEIVVLNPEPSAGLSGL